MQNDLFNSRAMLMMWKVSLGAVDSSDVQNFNLSSVCDELNETIEKNLCGEMSLKMAAILVNGAAKAYKLQVEQTLQDIGLKSEGLKRRKRKSSELETPQDDKCRRFFENYFETHMNTGST